MYSVSIISIIQLRRWNRFSWKKMERKNGINSHSINTKKGEVQNGLVKYWFPSSSHDVVTPTPYTNENQFQHFIFFSKKIVWNSHFLSYEKSFRFYRSFRYINSVLKSYLRNNCWNSCRVMTRLRMLYSLRAANFLYIIFQK